MHRVVLTGTFLVLASAVSAQQPAGRGAQATTTTIVSAADVSALAAKAKADRKPDQPNVVQAMVRHAPYTVNLESRAGVAPASVHEHEAELFYVIDGSGTLVTGGKLRDEKRTNAENLTGSGVEGGESRRVAKGDVIMVPENTPHWFSAVDGTLVLMSLHLPQAPGGATR